MNLNLCYLIITKKLLFFSGHNLPALKDTIIPYGKVSLYLVILKVAEIKLPTSARNAGLDEAQAGIKIARRNINNLRYADDTTVMAESKEELKSLLMRVKEEGEKTGLNLNIQKLRSWHLVPSLHGK